ncbi:hypothetical protein AGMMS4956_19310 [Bacteroidia bacterium]|nr:hypothetical protein AGMMS4956_19310 [Bacteroidia bacterium]
MSRALSISDVARYKPKTMPFDGKWDASFGKPEMAGSWIVWGKSGNGKTRFALQLCRYLSQFGRVAYDSLEEGLSLTMQKSIAEVGMSQASRRFILLDKEPIRDDIFTTQYFKEQVKRYLNGFVYDHATSQLIAQVLKMVQHKHRHDAAHTPTCLLERLERQKSPDIVVIDSLQYSGMTYADYRRLRDGFKGKLFVLISHASGSEPAGKVAGAIKFDANVKVFVEGYKAFPVSRYGGGAPFTIWEEGAERFYGVNNE